MTENSKGADCLKAAECRAVRLGILERIDLKIPLKLDPLKNKTRTFFSLERHSGTTRNKEDKIFRFYSGATCVQQ